MIARIDRCLPDCGEVELVQLHRMYELTLRLQSQLLSVIYDAEIFGGFTEQNCVRLAKKHAVGQNEDSVVTLMISEPLPSMKKMTEAIKEHWKAMLHAAIGGAAWQGPLPCFEKAFVEIEVITPRGSDNARLWDTSNRAVNVIINNLKGIFFEDNNLRIWPFRWLGSGEKKVLQSSVFRSWTDHVKSELGVFNQNYGVLKTS